MIPSSLVKSSSQNWRGVKQKNYLKLICILNEYDVDSEFCSCLLSRRVSSYVYFPQSNNFYLSQHAEINVAKKSLDR